MATLKSMLGVDDLTQVSEEQLTNFVENIRSQRQVFVEGAYEERTTRRKASTKRKGPQIIVTEEFVNELDDLDL